MSAAWDSELSTLAADLRGQGAISPEQAAVLQQLAADVSSLTRRGRSTGREVLVRSAVALTEAEKARLEAVIATDTIPERLALARRFGSPRSVRFEVEPELLGGLWLRMGDQVVDGSLRGRLQSLREQMG